MVEPEENVGDDALSKDQSPIQNQGCGKDEREVINSPQIWEKADVEASPVNVEDDTKTVVEKVKSVNFGSDVDDVEPPHERMREPTKFIGKDEIPEAETVQNKLKAISFEADEFPERKERVRVPTKFVTKEELAHAEEPARKPSRILSRQATKFVKVPMTDSEEEEDEEDSAPEKSRHVMFGNDMDESKAPKEKFHKTTKFIKETKILDPSEEVDNEERDSTKKVSFDGSILLEEADRESQPEISERRSKLLERKPTQFMKIEDVEEMDDVEFATLNENPKTNIRRGTGYNKRASDDYDGVENATDGRNNLTENPCCTLL